MWKHLKRQEAGGKIILLSAHFLLSDIAVMELLVTSQ